MHSQDRCRNKQQINVLKRHETLISWNMILHVRAKECTAKDLGINVHKLCKYTAVVIHQNDLWIMLFLLNQHFSIQILKGLYSVEIYIRFTRCHQELRY